MALEIQRGMVVKSKAGHDKNEYFVIAKKLDDEDRFVMIMNGKSRKIDSPKKKNMRHLSIVNKILPEDSLTSDKSIRKALAPFYKD